MNHIVIIGFMGSGKTKVGKIIVVICSVLFGIVLFFGITSRVSIADKIVVIDFKFI